MNVPTTYRLLAVAASVAVTTVLLAGPAYAQQSEGGTLSRSEVMAQVAAAQAAGTLLRPGEGSPTEPMATVSTKTRAERKAETLQARRDGAFLPPGEGMYRVYMSQQRAMAHSTKTRAERKAETQEAARKHQLLPAGEAGYPGRS